MAIKELLSLANSQIGVTEDKTNSVLYNQEFGLPHADWCVIFIWWLFAHTGNSRLLYDGRKIASCGVLWKWAEANGLTVDSSNIQPGDLVIFSFTEAHDHIGMCESSTASYVTTIDGNTSAAGSQNKGDSVLRRKRSKKYIFGVIRPRYPEHSRIELWHTVVKGDTLSKLARQNETTVQNILKLNPSITNPNLIRVGQRIRLL